MKNRFNAILKELALVTIMFSASNLCFAQIPGSNSNFDDLKGLDESGFKRDNITAFNGKVISFRYGQGTQFTNYNIDDQNNTYKFHKTKYTFAFETMNASEGVGGAGLEVSYVQAIDKTSENIPALLDYTTEDKKWEGVDVDFAGTILFGHGRLQVPVGYGLGAELLADESSLDAGECNIYQFSPRFNLKTELRFYITDRLSISGGVMGNIGYSWYNNSVAEVKASGLTYGYIGYLALNFGVISRK